MTSAPVHHARREELVRNHLAATIHREPNSRAPNSRDLNSRDLNSRGLSSHPGLNHRAARRERKLANRLVRLSLFRTTAAKPLLLRDNLT